MRWIIFFLYSTLLFGANIAPQSIIEASGSVQSISLGKENILAGTGAGTLEIYKLSDASKLNSFSFPLIKDFTGDEVPPKVFSVDVLNNSQRYLAVVQASSGARALYKIENSIPKVVIDASQNWFITKAKFIDSNRILIALLSNELILWDIKNAKALYRTQLNPSHFSDFALNEDKNRVACSCESGEISIVDVTTGKIIRVLKGGNVDNVYKVDFHRNSVLCAGQDRRGIVYDVKTGNYERFDGSFLIYAGALSPNEHLGAFAFNEQNDIVIFDLIKKEPMATLKGHKSTLNSIIFASNTLLVSSSDDKSIIIWRLP